MNSVVMKYNQIVGRDGDFGGSIITIQANIVSMFAKDNNKRKTRNFRYCIYSGGQKEREYLRLLFL